MSEESSSLTTTSTPYQDDARHEATKLILPAVSNKPFVAQPSVKSEDATVIYTMAMDPTTPNTQPVVVAPSIGGNITSGAFTVDAAQLAMMNLTSLQGAGVPVIQATGFPTSNGNQAIPMMIQGVGGSGALTFIYPAAMMTNTSATSSSAATTTTSSDVTVLLSQANTSSASGDIITVAPQVDTSEPPTTSEALSTHEAIIRRSREHPNLSLHKEMIDISELAAAAATSSIHSAITNQIIMGIKTEGAPPVVDHNEETSTSVSTNSVLSPPPLSEGDEGGYHLMPKRSKSLTLSKDEKVCRVCGDKALGCNFDAISCESCKAFFRRNALKEKQPNCLFESNCTIDINTRRFCPFCRLQKCFTIGMKKELILGDTEKKKRNEKVKQNREKRTTKGVPSYGAPLTPGTLGPQTPGTPATPCIEEDTVSDIPCTTHEVIIPVVEDESPKAEPVVDATRSPPPEAGLASNMGLTLGGMSFSMAGTAMTSVNNIQSAPPAAPDVTNLLSLSKFAHQNETSSNVQLDSFLVRRLTTEENHMLQELIQVYDLSFTADLEPLIHIKHLDPSLNQLVNQSSITVLRLIKFAKRLEEFIRLTQECQIGILKGTWIHILLLRSVSLYDSERDVWVTPKGDIPTEILKNATGFVKLHDDHVRYCKNIKTIIRDDLMIVVILLVIVLFSPEGPNVINRELVSNIQDKYLVLLKHYLESKYTYIRAADMFPSLMSKLKELKELAEIHSKYLLDVNPGEIEPIMLEILDLK